MTKKKRTRHNPEQIVKKLRDADAMLNVGKELAGGVANPRDQRSNISSLANAIWWHEGQRGQAIENA